MNCSRFQDQMLLYFGQKQLPEELREHLADCPACQALWEELTSLSDKLAGDDLFHPNDAQVEQLVSDVDVAIETIEQDKRHDISRIRGIWYKYVPIAAAAALVVGIAIGGYLANRMTLETRLSDIASNENTFVSLYEEDYEELDEGTIGILIYDFTAEHSYEASEWLLDDLTEEEFHYLENNFDVGDLL